MSRPKEIHFFDRHYEHGMGWYEAHFAEAQSNQVAGEATPAYMSAPGAIERMADSIPEALLILCVREPAERAWSHYWMERERGREHAAFEEVVREERHRIESLGVDAGGDYLRKGAYVHFLNRLLQHFDRDAIKVVVFEKMVEEPMSIYTDVCRYLGVASDYVPENLGDVVNPYVKIRSLTLRRWARRMPAELRGLVGKINTSRRRYPPLDPVTRSWLTAFYAPWNESLWRLLEQPPPSQWAMQAPRDTT